MAGALVLQGIILLAAAVTAWIFVHRLRQRNGKDPKTWPLLGLQLETALNFHRLHDWIFSFFRDDHRTVKLCIPSENLSFTVDPMNVEHILKANFRNYPQVRWIQIPFTYFSLLNRWFHIADYLKKLRAFPGLFQSVCDASVACWSFTHDQTRQTPFDIFSNTWNSGGRHITSRYLNVAFSVRYLLHFNSSEKRVSGGTL
ncbi:hypothetical protein KP509_24G047800 [Ceratopteris richardii]|uniref:Cytochrome P450 n=1 Tax=Ceratopteris richardii TaxID=49495 RepID=A0A8T2RUM5_CERRI|nr:hypothetical protein KP509_24G047800 [Ceratopteris richardii]